MRLKLNLMLRVISLIMKISSFLEKNTMSRWRFLQPGEKTLNDYSILTRYLHTHFQTEHYLISTKSDSSNMMEAVIIF